MIDLHCHILHGLDDGAKNLGEAAEMAKMAVNDGINKIVATPHLFRGEYTPHDLNIIEKKIDELQNFLQKESVDVEILKGAEVHISHNLIDEIRTKRRHLVLHNSSYMIMEFPAGHVFPGVKNLLFEMLSEGIRPIIAHPERNYVFMHSPEILYDLVKAGALSQANSGSFTGLYGKRVEEAAFRFLELNLIHFIASDAHNPRISSLWLSQAVEKVNNRMGDGVAVAALVNDNPGAILEDRELIHFRDPVDPEKSEKSLKIKIPRLFGR